MTTEIVENKYLYILKIVLKATSYLVLQIFMYSTPERSLDFRRQGINDMVWGSSSADTELRLGCRSVSSRRPCDLWEDTSLCEPLVSPSVKQWLKYISHRLPRLLNEIIFERMSCKP